MSTSDTAPTDLDSYSISVSPEFLLNKDPLSSDSISLISHKLEIRDHTNYNGWVYAGAKNEYYKIHPNFKKRFIRELTLSTGKNDIFPSPISTSLVTGHHQIKAHVFFQAMIDADVDLVRIQNYGLKFGLPMRDPSDPSQDAAEDNLWDLGCNFDADRILLVDFVNYLPPRQGRSFPLLFPMGKDFGSISFNIDYNGDSYYVKMYPRLTHLLKNFGQGHYPKQPPKNIVTLRRAFTLLANRAAKLKKVSQWRFGGFRIEVTVQAETLQDAIDKVTATPLLNVIAFQDPTDAQLRDYALRFRPFSKQEYMDNLKKQITVAHGLPHFIRGFDRAATSPFQQAVIVDLYNALGWNPGFRKPSNWRADGWWIEDERSISSGSLARTPSASPTPEPVAADLTYEIRAYSAVKMYQLFDKIKP
ncbi:hypothetical protein A4X13_0g9342, partial [Tilletia indica]